MSILVERLAGRIVSGDTPLNDLMALGSGDLEALPRMISEQGGTLEDVQRVFDLLESMCADTPALSRGVSFEDAIAIGGLPGAATIVKKLRSECPDVPPIRVFRALFANRHKVEVEASRVTRLSCASEGLEDLFAWLPVTLTLRLDGNVIGSFEIGGPSEAEVSRYRTEVESALAAGKICFDETLRPGATHHVVVDAMKRRVITKL